MRSIRACTAGYQFYHHSTAGNAFACAVKLRYRQSDQQAYVTMEGGNAKIEFAERQRAVTPGQYAALYMGDECIGGVIDKIVF